MPQIKKSNCLICKKDCINKFCSYKCYWQSKKGIYPVHTKQEIKPFFCLDCSKQFKHRARKTKRCMDCSKKAIKTWLKVPHLKSRGMNHFNWKGGICSENKLQRIKFRRTIQKQVLERDNYTCQICFESGGDLQVDHIKSWREHINLRFDINNCRTLCSRCHYKITFNKNMPENIQKWGHNLGRAVA